MIDELIQEALARTWGFERRPQNLAAHVRAIWNQKCPRCLRGSLFRRRLRTNDYCPVCCLRIEREEGYFSGAVAIAQLMSMVAVTLMILLLRLLVSGSPSHIMAIALAIYLPWLPGILRTAKTIWIHIDRTLDP